jgi:hypothetical protein
MRILTAKRRTCGEHGRTDKRIREFFSSAVLDDPGDWQNEGSSQNPAECFEGDWIDDPLCAFSWLFLSWSVKAQSQPVKVVKVNG